MSALSMLKLFLAAVLVFGAAAEAFAQPSDDDTSEDVLAAATQSYSSRRSALSHRNAANESWFPHSQSVTNTTEWAKHFDELAPIGDKRIAAGSFLTMADQAKPGDVVRLRFQRGDSNYVLALVYVGEEKFPDIDRSYSFFVYPFRAAMEYNTFPPRKHKAWLERVDRKSRFTLSAFYEFQRDEKRGVEWQVKTLLPFKPNKAIARTAARDGTYRIYRRGVQLVPSGADWATRFPDSGRVEDLDAAFLPNVRRFIAALEAGGANVRVLSTRRPAERAYLMHWAWRIARQDYDPQQVPTMEGVPIQWWHNSLVASRTAAQAMVNAFGIDPDLGVAPSLTSRHTAGAAIDMTITWNGALTIRRSNGQNAVINSIPRDGTNADLISVGAGYGVIHFINVQQDRNHWSTDGR